MSASLVVPGHIAMQQRRQAIEQRQLARTSAPVPDRTVNYGKIGEARLDLVPTVDECDPGLEPSEYNVLVAPARVPSTVGSGAILAPDEYVESAEMAMQVGRIVDVSPLAFNYDRWEGCEDRKPKVGDIIWFARYAGSLIEAAFDGEQYRLIKDKDINMIVRGRKKPEKVWELD